MTFSDLYSAFEGILTRAGRRRVAKLIFDNIGGGGGGGVTSFNTRTGAVTSQSGDYTAAQVGLGNVTNDAQALLSIYPSNVPTDGQLPVGFSTTSSYINRTVSGSGATITVSSVGVITISAIANGSLTNSSVTLNGHSLALGGTLSLTSGDVGAVPTSRTLTVGPDTFDLSANRTFLANVTNDTQTQSAVVPNTAPSDGQILVGQTSLPPAHYIPRTISGNGATITCGSTGVFSISAIANSSLSNSSITISGVSTALGGSINPPPDTMNDYGNSIVIPDTGNLLQPSRLTLSGSNRATLAGTARITLYDTVRTPATKYAVSPGSFTLAAGEGLLKYRRLTLQGNARATLTEDARIALLDLGNAPVSRLVLQG